MENECILDLFLFYQLKEFIDMDIDIDIEKIFFSSFLTIKPVLSKLQMSHTFWIFPSLQLQHIHNVILWGNCGREVTSTKIVSSCQSVL